MRKEISPEMYNYNKFPGPVFVHFDHIIKSDEISFSLLDNHKEAFNLEAFNQRFSEWLLKYDYIVGDWGNEQLRLKGFYKDDKPVANYNKISHLEDYLKEYCAFGCAYFVLENAEPREIISEDEEPSKRRRRRRRKPLNTKIQNEFTMATNVDKAPKEFKMTTNVNRDRQEKKRQRKTERELHDVGQHFTIRKKER